MREFVKKTQIQTDVILFDHNKDDLNLSKLGIYFTVSSQFTSVLTLTQSHAPKPKDCFKKSESEEC